MCAPPDVKLVSGGGASPMPVELATISRANYRMLFAARKLGAIVRKGRQSTDGQDGIDARVMSDAGECSLGRKSSLLIQGFLSNGKIFGAGKCESLESRHIEVEPQTGRFRRKQIAVLHFEVLAQKFFAQRIVGVVELHHGTILERR